MLESSSAEAQKIPSDVWNEWKDPEHLVQVQFYSVTQFNFFDSNCAFKVDSHLLQQSAFSAEDCINAEIEKFLSLCGNAPVHYIICTSVNEPLVSTQKNKIVAKRFQFYTELR